VIGAQSRARIVSRATRMIEAGGVACSGIRYMRTLLPLYPPAGFVRRPRRTGSMLIADC
jgi:hypothetical protein